MYVCASKKLAFNNWAIYAIYWQWFSSSLVHLSIALRIAIDETLILHKYDVANGTKCLTASLTN